MNENHCILIKISLKFAFKDPIDNNSALVKVMVWGQTGSKPLPEPVMTEFFNAIWCHFGAFYITKPQWFKGLHHCDILTLLMLETDRIFMLIWSITCLRVAWHLKSPEHQQAWYWLCSADWRCSNCIWVINNYIAYEGAAYIRGLTVIIQSVSSWAPFQYLLRHLIVSLGSRKIRIQNCTITLEFDRHLGSTAADVPVKFQSD